MPRPAGRNLAIATLALGLAGLAAGTLAGFRERSRTEFVSPGSRPGSPRDAAAEPALAVPASAGEGERANRDALGSPRAERKDGLRVQVVDHRGRPAAGIRVACGYPAPGAPALLEAPLCARTDEEGAAWIDLPAVVARAARARGAWGEGPLVRAEITADPLPEVALGPSDARESVVLRLPPTGSVRLQATDALGAPMRSATRFGLWARAGGREAPSRSALWVDASEGVAVLEHVATNLELRAVASAEGADATTESTWESGPRFPGEERILSVPVGPRWPRVHLRALDEEGRLLADADLDVALTWSPPRSIVPERAPDTVSVRVRTDAAGRAELPIRGDPAGGERTLRVRHLTEGSGAPGGAEPVLRAAEHDLSWRMDDGGLVDLGDVVLSPRTQGSGEARWVSGRVLDRAGTPVVGATVLASAVDLDGGPSRGPASWASTGPDGGFRVTGPRVDRRLSVRAVAPGLLGAEAVVLAGASGVEIRVQEAARWVGRVLLDPDVPPETLVVDLACGEWKERRALAGETLIVDDLPGGPIDVEIRGRAGGWLVQRLVGMPSLPARDRSDDLAHVVDLRGRLSLLRLRLTGPDGTPLDRVFARVRALPMLEPGPEPSPAGVWIRAGRLLLTVPREVASVTVQPRGYQAFEVPVLDAVQTVSCAR